MRALAQLVAPRRRVVGDKVRLTNRLTSVLKNYVPHVRQWLHDKDTALFCDVLAPWPTLKAVQLARHSTLERFFRDHHVRYADVIDQRIRAIKSATPLTTDDGIIAPHALLVAFGEQRVRYASAEALQKYAGIAPVTERSGNKTWVHWRWQCPTFLRQTFVAWAAEATRHSFGTRAYYQQQRNKGASHQAAVRALAFQWMRILFRCWQDRTPYNETVYLNALERRGSPLLHHLAKAS